MYSARLQDLAPDECIRVTCCACGKSSLLTRADLAKTMGPNSRLVNIEYKAKHIGCRKSIRRAMIEVIKGRG
jgi:hypothetical protein